MSSWCLSKPCQNPAVPAGAYPTTRLFRLDLASFTTTYMEPEAEEVIAYTQNINIIDSAQCVPTWTPAC